MRVHSVSIGVSIGVIVGSEQRLWKPSTHVGWTQAPYEAMESQGDAGERRLSDVLTVSSR